MSAIKYLKLGEFAAGRHPEMITLGLIGALKSVGMSRIDRNRLTALAKIAGHCKTLEGWEQIWLDVEELAEPYVPVYAVIDVRDAGPAVIAPAWGLIEQVDPHILNRVRTQLKTAGPFAVEDRDGVTTMYRRVLLGKTGHRWQEVWSIATPPERKDEEPPISTGEHKPDDGSLE